MRQIGENTIWLCGGFYIRVAALAQLEPTFVAALHVGARVSPVGENH